LSRSKLKQNGYATGTKELRGGKIPTPAPRWVERPKGAGRVAGPAEAFIVDTPCVDKPAADHSKHPEIADVRARSTKFLQAEMIGEDTDDAQHLVHLPT